MDLVSHGSAVAPYCVCTKGQPCLVFIRIEGMDDISGNSSGMAMDIQSHNNAVIRYSEIRMYDLSLC